MRTVTPLNRDWYFSKGLSQPPASLPEDGEAVTLPHCWNGQDGQDGGNDYFRGPCCYTRRLLSADLPQGERHYLEVNGANSSSQVWLNGRLLAEHHGGYSTFRPELTDWLQAENLLTILVDNAPNEEVYPQTADFTFYGGLYRDVNLISLPEVHFDLEGGGPGLQVTPIVAGDEAKVTLSPQLQMLPEDCDLSYEILDGEGALLEGRTCSDRSACFTIAHPHLWNGVKDPYLYTARVSLLRGETVLDALSVPFGCRTFEIHPEQGFLLNGERYPLLGVSRHQDRPGIGNALLPEHHREDIELIREMGANTIRLAHYQHDQYFYDLCDQYGMVVWAEIPYISRHMPGGRENTLSQMRELIDQCYNHPSIAVWGLSNEITMDGAKDPDLLENHRLLNDLCHRLDPTRPTAIACISMCDMSEEIVHLPDVVSYNHYFGWYGGKLEDYGPWFDRFHQTYPQTPIGVSEYGCEALNWHNSRPESGDYSEEYQAIYHESLIRQLFTRDYLWATHVWNMFDFGADARAEGGENGQNHKGLVTFDRTYRKDAFYAYKAWLSDEPFVHICSKRYVDRVEDVTKVTVYSNQPQVELFANGVSLGTQSAPDHLFYFEVPNAGKTRLEAVAGSLRDESTIRKVETINSDYILREQGAVLNWFDITEPEGRFSLNDKLGDIIKTFRGKFWFLGLFLILAKKQSGPKAPAQKGKKKAAPKANLDKGVIDMISSFTVLRFTGMVGMRNVRFTKEELLDMNRKLNRIKKPR